MKRSKSMQKGRQNKLHTDKNYTSPRDRINLSLARRVVESSPAPIEDFTRPTFACAKCTEERPRPTKSWGLEGYPLASVYSPIQHWQNIYDEDAAFTKGTIFKELDLPFVCGDRRGGNCRGK